MFIYNITIYRTYDDESNFWFRCFFIIKIWLKNMQNKTTFHHNAKETSSCILIIIISQGS